MLVDPPKTLVFFYAELFLTKPLRTAVGIEKLHYSFKKNLLWSEEHNFVKSNNCTNINKKNLALLLKILNQNFHRRFILKTLAVNIIFQKLNIRLLLIV